MLKIGVIGFGYWGPNLVRTFTIPARSRVTTVSDLNPAQCARAAERFPGIHTTKRAHDLFEDTSIDAVLIATPVRSHFALAEAALLAGKHVLVEKPMTETVQDSERLIELAAKFSRVLMVDYTFIYTPAVRRIRELV